MNKEDKRFVKKIKLILQNKLKTIKDTIYFEEHIEELFDDERVRKLVKVALLEFVEEQNWSLEYSVEKGLRNLSQKGN